MTKKQLAKEIREVMHKVIDHKDINSLPDDWVVRYISGEVLGVEMEGHQLKHIVDISDSARDFVEYIKFVPIYEELEKYLRQRDSKDDSTKVLSFNKGKYSLDITVAPVI